MLSPSLLSKAIAQPRYIGLCIWAFKQFWWVDSRLKSLSLAALNTEASVDVPLTPELQRDIQQRVKAIAWTGKIHPVRPKCLHRSMVLYHWLTQQGITPQLEIGWGDLGHAWITHRGVVLNDRADIARITPPLVRPQSKVQTS